MLHSTAEARAQGRARVRRGRRRRDLAIWSAGSPAPCDRFCGSGAAPRTSALRRRATSPALGRSAFRLTITVAQQSYRSAPGYSLCRLRQGARPGHDWQVHGFVAPTDHGWYQFLRARPEITEVNFWRPGGTAFRAVAPGAPFFFKLKRPHNAIGGFGLFARAERLPAWLAWDVFGRANGTRDEHDLLLRLDRLGGRDAQRLGRNRMIGCVAITEPVFFAPDEWVAVPSDWSRNIVSGRTEDLSRGDGLRMWSECLERAAARTDMTIDWRTRSSQCPTRRQAGVDHAAAGPIEFPTRSARCLRAAVRRDHGALIARHRRRAHPAVGGRRYAFDTERRSAPTGPASTVRPRVRDDQTGHAVRRQPPASRRLRKRSGLLRAGRAPHSASRERRVATGPRSPGVARKRGLPRPVTGSSAAEVTLLARHLMSRRFQAAASICEVSSSASGSGWASAHVTCMGRLPSWDT